MSVVSSVYTGRRTEHLWNKEDLLMKFKLLGVSIQAFIFFPKESTKFLEMKHGTWVAFAGKTFIINYILVLNQQLLYTKA